jgi:hypothetical protein
MHYGDLGLIDYRYGNAAWLPFWSAPQASSVPLAQVWWF